MTQGGAADWAQAAIDPPAAWAHLPFFQTNWPELRETLRGQAEQGAHILPPPASVFAALNACAPETTQVIILGQDPYPTPGHGHGLAFSVEQDVRPLPRSLNNIFKELTSDMGGAPRHGDLRFWADQGVLLLNTALTVKAGDAGSHAKLGWQALIQHVLTHLNDRPRAAVLWGAHAQKSSAHLTHPDHFKIATPHPSPLSARRGFFDSRPFSKVNAWLTANHHTPINWTEPAA